MSAGELEGVPVIMARDLRVLAWKFESELDAGEGVYFEPADGPRGPFCPMFARRLMPGELLYSDDVEPFRPLARFVGAYWVRLDELRGAEREEGRAR